MVCVWGGWEGVYVCVGGLVWLLLSRHTPLFPLREKTAFLTGDAAGSQVCFQEWFPPPPPPLPSDGWHVTRLLFLYLHWRSFNTFIYVNIDLLCNTCCVIIQRAAQKKKASYRPLIRPQHFTVLRSFVCLPACVRACVCARLCGRPSHLQAAADEVSHKSERTPACRCSPPFWCSFAWNVTRCIPSCTTSRIIHFILKTLCHE